jgi:hypothetical protein
VAERGLEQDLALARQALRGPAAMKARVRERLAAEAGLSPNAASEPRAPTPLERLLRRVKQRPGLATVTLLMGLSFGAGFWLGQHPSASSPGADPPGPTTRALPTEVVSGLAVARSEASAPAPEKVEPAPDPAPAPDLSPAPAVPRSATPTRARGAARAPAAVLHESSWRGAAEGRESDALAGEVALLERTERAIRKGDAALALGLLDELDEKFPAAALPEERRAAHVLASCARDVANGDPSAASALARRFLAESPGSVYAARIREACSAPAPTIGGVRLKEPIVGGH